jgi:arylsulfatase A-like enzyme
MLEEEKDASEDISGFGRQIEGMGRAAVGWLVLFCCCADAFAKDETPKPDAAITVGRGAVPAGMVWIPGTEFIMGTDDARSFQARDVTVAQLLKSLGYATGQFGKNHLGDRNEYLPTLHGFDEFFGNLYHLNAGEDPESFTYPQDPNFREQLGPRGVLRCKAIDSDDPTIQPPWGKVGKQSIEDTGPLNKKRMETIDDETSRRDRLHEASGADGQTVLLLDEQHAHAFSHACASRASRQARLQGSH